VYVDKCLSITAHYSFAVIHLNTHYTLIVIGNMIKVSRLDGTEFLINPHQIECIEIRPDTALVMLSGKHYIIREEADEVLSRIESYRKRIVPPVIQPES